MTIFSAILPEGLQDNGKAGKVPEKKGSKEAPPGFHVQLLSILNNLEAIVYVADMETHELLFLNHYAHKLFGDGVGKKCWKTLQNGQSGPCSFCTNPKLLKPDGSPGKTEIWELQNTVNNQWYECRDKAIPWKNGRWARLEIATDITNRKAVETEILERDRIARMEKEIARCVAGEENLSAMLQGCAEALVRHFDVAFSRIWTCNRQENVLELQAGAGLHTHLDGGHSRIPLGEYKVGKIAQLKTPHITNQVGGEALISDPEWIRREGIVSFAGYPLILGGKCSGVVALFGKKPLGETVLRALSSVADVISLGIERKESEASVHAALAFQEAIENSISAGVAAFDMQGRVLYVNQAFCTMVGWSESELLGNSPPLPYWPPEEEDRNRQILTDALRGKAPAQGRDRRFRRKGGEIFPAWVTFAPLKNRTEQVIGWVESVADISQRKQMEETLLKVRNLESIGTLAAGIAHDFNNLLTAIMGNISLAEMNLPPASSPAERLADAVDSCLKAKDLTARLLTFSRGGEPFRQRMELSSLLRESCRFALAGSAVTLDDTGVGDCRLVEIDENQVRQVIQNIVLNAREAMPEGGKLTVTLKDVEPAANEVFPLPPGYYVRIDIVDTGTGMYEKDLEKIFDPYYSTKEMGTVKGMGLGLAIAHSIIEKHGGTVLAASKIGEGSTFSIYLPAIYSARSVQSSGIQEATATPKRVLVMDDDVRVRETSQEILQQLGYEVEVAEEGGEALASYNEALESNRPFELVILDLTVPGGKGAQWTLKALRKINPSVKAILVSGYMNDPLRNDYRPAGFDGALTKPYRVRELKDLLDRILLQGPGERGTGI